MYNKLPRNPFTEKDYIPSFSFLKALSIENNSNPQKAVYKWLNPTPSSKDQIFGLAVENLITYQINEKNFNKEFIIFKKPSPNQTMGAKINKEAYLEIEKESENKGLIIINEDEYFEAVKAAESVLKDNRVLNLISNQDNKDIQKTIFGEIDKMKYKGVPDIVLNQETKRIIDIKTCTSASYNFLYQAKTNFYDVQLSSYMRAVNASIGIFIAVENKEPYSHNIFIFHNETETYNNAIDLLKSWLMNFYYIKENKLWDNGYEFYNQGFFPFEIRRFTEN